MKKNNLNRKALLAAAFASISILCGCNNKKIDSISEPTYITETSNKPSLYDSEFKCVIEVATLKSNTDIYDSNLRFVRKSYENEVVGVYHINDDYAIIHDNDGNRYIVDIYNLNIIDSEIDSYYAYILNETPVYSEPMTYNFEHTGETIPVNQLFIIIKDFGEKVYALDGNGKPKILREIDIEKLPNKFIEIDLSKQKLNFYNDKVISLTTNIVSGKTEGDNPTPSYEGCYEINNNKTKNKTLKDDAQVEYWMPFIGDLFGIHDASWRTYFGDEIYKTNGSHGCINIPSDKAQELYERANVGTKVLIHK